MDKTGFVPHYRTTRWYEWGLMLLLMALVGGVRAESVYKCTNTHGDVAYQAQACSSLQESVAVTIAPAPAYAESPKYAVAKSPADLPRTSRESHVASRTHDVSYECRVSDGEIFYRHSPCPHSLNGDKNAHKGKGRGRGGESLTVSSTVISRAEACVQIHRAGAIGRAGREHDEDISTYERDLGKDPCR
jgi:uncharacterized protein DUF4124